MRCLLADKDYDADRLRRSLRCRCRFGDPRPAQPQANHPLRQATLRRLIENAFRRLEDFRRVATRHDRLAADFLSGVALATALAFRP